MDCNGKFVWYELMTTDPEASARFYGAVVGWQSEPAGNTTAAGHKYDIFSIPGKAGTGGMMTLTKEMIENGAKPGWLGYIGVDDLDRKTKQFKESGGTIHMAPTEIPGIGRFSVVADPQGAVIYLFKPQMPEGPLPEMLKPGEPGTIGWNELCTEDAEQAWQFYSELFGWKQARAVDMGSMGIYRVFAHEGVDIGGMMNKSSKGTQPFWNYYFTVPAMDTAIEKIKTNGGQITNGPHPVPGGSWIVHAVDPQGATFCLTAAQR